MQICAELGLCSWIKRCGGLVEKEEFGRADKGSRHQDAFFVNILESVDESVERCDLQNISSGGMAIVAPQKIEAKVGALVVVQFPLGRSMSRIQTRVEIVEVTDELVRLRFVDDSPIFLEAVSLAIRSWEQRQSPDEK